ncbi:MAG: exo-alpha-sialidase [Chloroflexi bacterium]|nr:exo-alpha-sialidase [Chloroflexota bacterium]
MSVERTNAPWKWDVTIYDRPGWVGRFRGRARLTSPDGARLYLRFEELERATYYGDYFMGRHRDTWLVSPDGGRTWQHTTAGEAPNVDGVVMPDGGRLVVTHAASLLRGEALRDYLERSGLGHMWQEESFAWWEMAEPSRREELEQKGIAFSAVTHPSEFLAYLRDLRVGTCPPGRRTWTWRPVEGIPPMARLAGWWRQTGVVLDDGTVVGCVHGRDTPDEPHDSAFALRSTDGGRTWELSLIAQASEKIGFSEVYFFPVRDGRLLAMARSNAGDAHLYRCYSADGGRTWSALERTPIWGFPAHVIRLHSGALLCAYAYRRYPQGFRAVLSHDEGETWDLDNEKLLRDDATGSVGYPISVQLADGTIFTACELGKPAHAGQEGEGRSVRRTAAGPEDVRPTESHATGSSRQTLAAGRGIDMEARPQAYVAGSRYTEDYVAPLGRR